MLLKALADADKQRYESDKAAAGIVDAPKQPKAAKKAAAKSPFEVWARGARDCRCNLTFWPCLAVQLGTL